MGLLIFVGNFHCESVVDTERWWFLVFTYQAALIWNAFREVLRLDDFSKKVSSLKTAVKNKILKIQAEGDPIEWEQCSWNSFHYKLNYPDLISNTKTTLLVIKIELRTKILNF